MACSLALSSQAQARTQVSRADIMTTAKVGMKMKARLRPLAVIATAGLLVALGSSPSQAATGALDGAATAIAAAAPAAPTQAASMQTGSYWPPVTIWWTRANVESAWNVLGVQSTVCMLPIPTQLTAICYKPATQANAIASAHYQHKRIKQVYYGCTSGAYCNYSDWYVLP